VTHAESGCAVTPAQVHSAGRKLDEEQDVERLEPDRLDGEEVGREDP